MDKLSITKNGRLTESCIRTGDTEGWIKKSFPGDQRTKFFLLPQIRLKKVIEVQMMRLRISCLPENKPQI
jgi:hypothetical protein